MGNSSNDFTQQQETIGIYPLIIREHIELLHRLADGLTGKLIVCSRQQEPNEPKAIWRPIQFDIGDIDAMVAKTCQEAKKPWTNVFFGAYVARPDLSRFSRGGNADIVPNGVLMLGVDQDADKGKGGILPLDSNYVIQTSALNLQSFYLLDPKARSTLHDIHAVGERLREVVGADSPTGDTARIFRMPGTLNWPTPEKIKGGRASIPHLATILKTPSGYTKLVALSEAIREQKAKTYVRPDNDTDDAPVSDRAPSAILINYLKRHDIKSDTKPDRSAAAFAAFHRAMDEGFSDEEIQKLVEQHPDGVGARYIDDPKKLHSDIERARQKWQPPQTMPGQLPFGFSMESEYLWRRDNKTGKPCKVCSRIDVIASMRDSTQDNWKLAVQITNPHGQLHQVIIPWDELSLTSGDRDPVRRLRRAGLRLMSGRATNDLRDFLNAAAAHPGVIACSVARTGWQDNITFALPNQIITARVPDKMMLWETDQTAASEAYAGSGTLTEWQEQIAKPCASHPLLIVALCQGFVGPLLDLCDVDGFGIHLFGKSSKGKTTAADIAASIWGPPKAFGRTWKTTITGLELIASAHNEVVVILDELNQCGDPEKVGEAIYMLTGGQGKSRGTREVQLRSIKTWAVPYLSTGEFSTRDYIGRAYKAKATAGQSVRCLDIRLSEDSGIFRDGDETLNAALASSLKVAAHNYHGTAGPAFLKQVVAHRDHTQASIRLLRRSFESDAYIEALMMQHPNGQVLRVKDNQLFVLYAAGVLASQLSILPFSEQQVREAAIHILKLWIEERDGIGAQEDHEAQEMIRGFIQMNEHRFIRIEEGDSCPDRAILVQAPHTSSG